VTHDQTEAMALSDLVAVVNKGRILQIGTPSDVYLRPQTEFVAAFVGQTNLLYGRAQANGADLSVDVGWEAPVQALRTGGVETDRDVAVSIRPESIEIVAAGDAGNREAADNRIIGEVRGVSFLGQQIRYTVQVGPRQVVVATNPRIVFSIGDAVELRFPKDSTVAVPRDVENPPALPVRSRRVE
jgi:iron(III) transport system ATP-binding protein